MIAEAALLATRLSVAPAIDDSTAIAAGEHVFVHRCLDCHRSGSPVDVDLESDAPRHRRALTAAKAVEDGLMPPWLPGDRSAPLLGCRRLAPEERAALLSWLRSGARRTKAFPPAIAPAPSRTAITLAVAPEWIVAGEPDMQLRSFALELGVDRPLRIGGIEFEGRPPGSIHAVSLLADTTGFARRLDASDPAPGYDAPGDVGWTASGSLGALSRFGDSFRLPEGLALEVPAGSVIVAEVHAEPRGKPESASSRIGLVEADRDSVPVDAHSFSRRRPATLNADARAISIIVRAASSAASIRVTATAPDGCETALLDLPKWNDRFAEPWHFAEGIRLARGTMLAVEWARNADAPIAPPTSHAAAMEEPTVVVLTAPETRTPVPSN